MSWHNTEAMRVHTALMRAPGSDPTALMSRHLRRQGGAGAHSLDAGTRSGPTVLTSWRRQQQGSAGARSFDAYYYYNY